MNIRKNILIERTATVKKIRYMSAPANQLPNERNMYRRLIDKLICYHVSLATLVMFRRTQ